MHWNWLARGVGARLWVACCLLSFGLFLVRPAVAQPTGETRSVTATAAPAHRPVVVAHRGESSRAPENTLVAFEQAIQAGADWIELDVHLTADSKVIVIHDETVNRTTNGHGAVADLTLAQLQALDAGSWFGPTFAQVHLPTLDQVLDMAKGRIRVLIELKRVEKFGRTHQSGRAEFLTQKCIDSVVAHGMTHDVMFHTFYPSNLTALKRLAGSIPYGFLFNQAVPTHLATVFARARGASGFHPNLRFTTRSLVALAHSLKMSVFVFTAHTERQFAKAVALEVDGIITDEPRECRAFLELPAGPVARTAVALKIGR